MEFSLIYQGDLPPNGDATVKWRLRKQFDAQMRRLWAAPPLKDNAKYIDQNYLPSECYLGRKVGDIEFVSPISEKISTHADLTIQILSAGQGQKLTLTGGDIDNRVKTLLDSLQAPQSRQEIPSDCDVPDDGRIYSVLDDDKLVNSLTVRIGRLLTVDDYSRTALAVVDVRVKASRGIIANASIAL